MDFDGEYRVNVLKTYLLMEVSSVAVLVVVVAVVGRRLWRDSWRYFETPLDLLNDELDLDALWLFEKLLLTVCGGS